MSHKTSNFGTYCAELRVLLEAFLFELNCTVRENVPSLTNQAISKLIALE